MHQPWREKFDIFWCWGNDSQMDLHQKVVLFHSVMSLLQYLEQDFPTNVSAHLHQCFEVLCFCSCRCLWTTNNHRDMRPQFSLFPNGEELLFIGVKLRLEAYSQNDAVKLFQHLCLPGRTGPPQGTEVGNRSGFKISPPLRDRFMCLKGKRRSVGCVATVVTTNTFLNVFTFWMCSHKIAIRPSGTTSPVPCLGSAGVIPSFSSLWVIAIEVIPKPPRGVDPLKILLLRETYLIRIVFPANILLCVGIPNHELRLPKLHPRLSTLCASC